MEASVKRVKTVERKQHGLYEKRKAFLHQPHRTSGSYPTPPRCRQVQVALKTESGARILPSSSLPGSLPTCSRVRAAHT